MLHKITEGYGRLPRAIAILSLAASLTMSYAVFAQDDAARGGGLEFQKGMCYPTWDKDRYLAPQSDASLEMLVDTGTEWVAIVPNWYQERVYTTSIFPTEKTPTDTSIMHAINYVHGLGKKVMLKPHIDIVHSEGGSWRGEIACPTDVEWEAWFDSYAAFILHYAKIAQDAGVELFCIGTELSTAATANERLWREKVIAPARGVYKGPITYAANWNEEYKAVKFWDAMDYVGIDAYFPLSDEDAPDLETIKKGWEKWVKDLEEFQAKVSKPIIFPEVGYCSADGAARMPWSEATTGKANGRLQANCYEALFQVFWDKPWFYGMYWWKWGTDVRFGGPSNKGYTPQNKPALDIIKKWYKGPAPSRDTSLFEKAAG